MAKSSRGRRRITSRRPSPYPSPSSQAIGASFPKHPSQKKNEWEDVTCSVCMEFPHNAVLLLCSSHEKGCRPYMCGTSFRFSNCLHQYKSSSTSAKKLNVGSADSWSEVSSDLGSLELACPLCRGRVKGWTVVEGAREYLNLKERGCMEERCVFVGDYRGMRKHVRTEHPCAHPREVDPTLDQRWLRLEREREREDVISSITSSIPGATVFGDYVIEGGDNYSDGEDEEEEGGGFDPVLGDELLNVVLLLHGYNGGTNVRRRRPERTFRYIPEEGRENGNGRNVVGASVTMVNNRHRLGRLRFRDRLRDGSSDENG